MKFFKNKFFITVLSIAIFSVIFTSTLAVMGQSDPIKNVLNTLAIPFRSAGLKIAESFDGFKLYFSSIEKLNEENQSLKDEIERLEDQLADSNAVKDENERLRDYLEIKKTYPDLKLCEALIVGHEGENYMTVFTLNKGRLDGITVGMPVITLSGLVGSVSEVGDSWCCVRTIVEATSATGAYVSRSGEIGVVEGDILLKGTGKCRLNYISDDADIVEGDMVYTSGLGSVYPRDLLIGKISEIKSNDYIREKYAVVESTVDFNSLKYVMIVTGRGVIAE
jgi:rod shape-determining protein MreC